MFISKVRTSNWMAFAGEQTVGPLPPGPIAIIGSYSDNARRSNWSGKTAWLEAMRFALTGAHRKRLDDSLITHGAPGLEVEVEMSTGVRIVRVRPRGGPTVLRVYDEAALPGQAMERDAAEEYLARLLRLPVDDFDNTAWFGQGDVQALVGKTSGVRREVFARWLELDVWERAGVTGQRAAREARTLLEVARGASNGPPPRDRGLIEDEIAGGKAGIEEHTASRAEIDQQLEDLGIFATLAVRRSDFELAVRTVKALRDELSAVPHVDEPAVEAAAEVVAKERTAVDIATKDHAAARQLIGGRFDGQCPVTCNACPVADDVVTHREAFVARAQKAGEEVSRARAALESAHAVVAVGEAGKRKRAALITRVTDATARARAAKVKLEEVETSIAELGLENQPDVVESLRVKRALIDSKLAHYTTGQGALVEELRNADTYAAREVKRAKAIGEAERAARVAQLVAKALGGSGIAARIASVSLAGLEQRANALLSGLGLSFSLTWERELSDPAPACGECGHVYEKRARARECPSCGAVRTRKKSDELDILVDDGSGEVEDVRAKSGGAKVLVASAIRLAGGMMLRERRGSPLEVAFVDEPFGELDAENRDALARTFAGLLSSVGLEQAFVVSHDAQLLAGLPYRVVVTRDGNASRLELQA